VIRANGNHTLPEKTPTSGITGENG